MDLLIGADLVAAAGGRAEDAGARDDALILRNWAAALGGSDAGARATEIGLDEAATAAARRHPDLRHATTWEPELEIVVDRERARFSAWYELFPRSASPDPDRHGTLRDVVDRLPYVAGLGFDVVYLPPIHPIGRDFRKGRNNATEAGETDPGSPWAIGAADGGHTAVHPGLGTVADVRALVRRRAGATAWSSRSTSRSRPRPTTRR